MKLKHLVDPPANEIGESAEDFLKFLGEPSSILISGEDQSRCRALVTLLHGNEPSGLMAIQRWLKSNKKPVCNILCIIASVEAALREPAFSYRVLPGKRDLNRCFNDPFDDEHLLDEQGQLSKVILECLKTHNPECVIDMHNTSGSGPAFGVAVYEDRFHEMLASLFTQRLIVTHIRLGAIMEITEFLAPTITVEVGGRLDESAHQIAWEGLCRYFLEENILESHNVPGTLELMKNPVRLELNQAVTISYSSEEQGKFDLVLDSTIERLNTGVTPKGTVLGSTAKSRAEELFVARNSQDQCVLEQMLTISDGKLVTAMDLKLFMVTSNAEIAKMDCLFYAVKDDGTELLIELN